MEEDDFFVAVLVGNLIKMNLIKIRGLTNKGLLRYISSHFLEVIVFFKEAFYEK